MATRTGNFWRRERSNRRARPFPAKGTKSADRGGLGRAERQTTPVGPARRLWPLLQRFTLLSRLKTLVLIYNWLSRYFLGVSWIGFWKEDPKCSGIVVGKFHDAVEPRQIQTRFAFLPSLFSLSFSSVLSAGFSLSLPPSVKRNIERKRYSPALTPQNTDELESSFFRC